jgi:hypothetical protein
MESFAVQAPRALVLDFCGDLPRAVVALVETEYWRTREEQGDASRDVGPAAAPDGGVETGRPRCLGCSGVREGGDV